MQELNVPLRCRGPARRSTLAPPRRGDARMQARAVNAPLPCFVTRENLRPSRRLLESLGDCAHLSLSTDDLAAASGKSTGCESMQVGQRAQIKADGCLSVLACSRAVMPCCLSV